MQFSTPLMKLCNQLVHGIKFLANNATESFHNHNINSV